MQENEQEKNIFNFMVRIFHEERPKLVDRNELSEMWAELYDKSLFMGIGTAVTFVIGKGDSLSISERLGLSQGKIPDGYAGEGFYRLSKSLPEIKKDDDKRNFCFAWFNLGIKAAVEFMERELNK